MMMERQRGEQDKLELTLPNILSLQAKEGELREMATSHDEAPKNACNEKTIHGFEGVFARG